MIPVREVPTNDSGGGTDGSVFDNAFFQDFQDKIDASVQRVLTPSTVTGAQNNYAPAGFSTASGYVTLPWNGAADAVFSGFAAGINGQRVTWINESATKVAYFKHLSGLSASGKQFSNVATSGDTPIAAGGFATFEYDTSSGTGVWKLITHEQGAAIAYTPTWAVGTPSLGNGTLTGRYVLRGKQVSFQLTWTAGSTTTFGGSSGWTFTVPLASEGATYNGTVKGIRTGVSHRTGTWVLGPSATTFTIFSDGDTSSGWGATDPVTWASGDTFTASGTYQTS